MLLLRLIARLLLVGAVGFTVALAAALADPSEPAIRILGPVDDSARVALPGSIPASVEVTPYTGVAVDSAVDEGAVEDSMPTGRMLLLLRRSPAQEEALRDFILAAHAPGDPAFHRWLTPGQFGSLYGPSGSDVATVAAWLESHGLNVDRVSAGRVAIEFSGTAGQMREAFQIRVHRFLIEGEEHLASASNPTVPAALAPVIAGLAPVSDLQPRPQVRVLGPVRFNPRTHQASTLWTYPTVGGTSYVLAPGDFATQYDIGPVYKAGITGSGQSIAIVSASNVDLSLVQAYRNLFGLAANLPMVVVDGQDPGQTSAAAEAYLDIELAGAIAPGAKVILYTSGGTALTNGLALAALRAVEDDQAGIVSVSYGECELELGQNGNAFWSALWQQAAAQGQTVFVSAGDAGSAGCDNFEVQSAAFGGFQVNGIASTPYNVAVGGTDFYYSQNAASATAVSTQLAAYWTSATAAPAVSLKQPVPEQTWNDFFGYNLVDGGNPINQLNQTILAGGGGMSNAAIYPAGSPRGYPKPAWQAGSGVPADRLRDLPDLSLFAADGGNLSFYPICASPGDCSSANKTASGAVAITGVGGTSASAPAMAAIQALVNQSAGGWQGQANFVYYPLAASQQAAFRDVKVGSNQVLCYPGTANCIAGAAKTRTSGFSLEGGFGAFTGFDFATGLGSVDVANLVKYWGTVVRAPTVTTLNVSPSALAHGKATMVTGTVAASGGSGAPTGTVSLTGNSGLSHYTGVGDFPLAGGSLSAQIDNLPGGTWQVSAVYSGDGSYAPSKSLPVTVTVTPENNTLSNSGWVWNPYDLYLYPLSTGMTLPYGAQIYLDAQPVSRNAAIATQPTPATGTVSFTDKLGTSTISAIQPLDGAGVAEWSTGVFAPGIHTVGATYSGDASYTSSTAAAAAFTVISGTTSLTVKPLVQSVAAGAAVSVDVQLATGYLPLYGAPPTGSVTVTLGARSLTAPLLAYGPTGSARMEAVVTFTGVAAGILPLTASYPGDGNWLGSAANGGTVVVLASRMTPTVALVSSSASPAPGQTFTLTATVAAPSGKPAPTGSVAFVADGQSFNSLANLTSGTASLSIPASSIANGINIFAAVYQGDGNYTTAASKAVSVTVARPDFSLTTLTAEVPVARGKTAAGTLVLTPLNGFSGTVAVTASTPAGIAAVPATATPLVSAAATDLVNLTVAASVAPGVYPVAVTASGGGHVHTAQILVAVR